MHPTLTKRETWHKRTKRIFSDMQSVPCVEWVRLLTWAFRMNVSLDSQMSRIVALVALAGLALVAAQEADFTAITCGSAVKFRSVVRVLHREADSFSSRADVSIVVCCEDRAPASCCTVATSNGAVAVDSRP